MPYICAKFGGTSLSTGEGFLRVKNIINMNQRRRMIVVSAPGKRFEGDEKVTDLLIRYAKGGESRALEAVKERFRQIARVVDADIDDALDEIEANALAGASREYIVSRGEYLSARLMADLLRFLFLDAKDALPFKDGCLREKAAFENIARAFDPEVGCVMPGFYGADEAGRIALFPRGGSDITGAVAAAGILADVYENWTDVDGVYDLDPRLHPRARLLPSISISDMKRLAESGACVLHPDTLACVQQRGIHTIVKNTFNLSAPGTLILPD